LYLWMVVRVEQWDRIKKKANQESRSNMPGADTSPRRGFRVESIDITTKQVNSVSFSCDGKKIALACADRTIRVSSLSEIFSSSRKTQTLSQHKNDIKSVRFHPTEKDRLVSVSNEYAYFTRLSNGVAKQCVYGIYQYPTRNQPVSSRPPANS
jgi:WD40 repeat protein